MCGWPSGLGEKGWGRPPPFRGQHSSNANRLCRTVSPRRSNCRALEMLRSSFRGTRMSSGLHSCLMSKQRTSASRCPRMHSIYCTTGQHQVAGVSYLPLWRGMSAYWWSRVAAGYGHVGHLLLHRAYFLAMYVDDELSLFPAATAPLVAGLVVALACVLGKPLCWKKIALGPCV